MRSARQSVEAFHLVFLRALAARAEDKSLVALKGGCNLRFFFGSVRYSEDIDFDVVTIATGTLKNMVERLLTGPLVVSPLRAMGVEIAETSAPKQTPTTQRWKVGLGIAGASVLVRTKIEFSRRDVIAGATFDATPAGVTRAHGLAPVLATHYGRRAAIAQKVHALHGRAEPQARDVFDLAHLFAGTDQPFVPLPEERRWLAKAIDHAIGISYDEYSSKVVAFLDPEQAAPLESKAAWEELQERVVAELEAVT